MLGLQHWVCAGGEFVRWWLGILHLAAGHAACCANGPAPTQPATHAMHLRRILQHEQLWRWLMEACLWLPELRRRLERAVLVFYDGDWLSRRGDSGRGRLDVLSSASRTTAEPGASTASAPTLARGAAAMRVLVRHQHVLWDFQLALRLRWLRVQQSVQPRDARI